MNSSKIPMAPLSIALLGSLLISEGALAYVGPGAGLTMLGALWGVLVAIVLAIMGVLLWPIRAMLARRRHAKTQQESAEQG